MPDVQTAVSPVTKRKEPGVYRASQKQEDQQSTVDVTEDNRCWSYEKHQTCWRGQTCPWVHRSGGVLVPTEGSLSQMAALAGMIASQHALAGMIAFQHAEQ